MKKIYIAIFVLLMSLIPIQKSYALSCIQPPPPEVAIHQYDVVVIATVTKVKETISSLFGSGYDLGNGTLVEADVSLSFKGYSDNIITFTEDIQWGESKVGTEYLLFLNKKGEGYESPLCSPTIRTPAFDKETLIKTLSAESTTVVEADQLNESNKSEFSWGWFLFISIIIMLILIATVIFYRSGKGKSKL